MKRKKIKGRKIYKTKERNYLGRNPFSKFMSGALTVLLIGGIGFLGYSLAEPIINYTRHEGDEPISEPSWRNSETTTATSTTTVLDVSAVTSSDTSVSVVS
ncbi:MAG: hypothetical protein K2I00_09810 [Ruminococcus sp.]|nr:hypothetical protein [Ruminococcus sp.]